MNHTTPGNSSWDSISAAAHMGNLLISQVSTVNSLINFVTGEQMRVALTAIGDNHFRTAERVLGNLPNARDKAALLRIGISHLEGAHTAYQKQWYPLKGQWYPLKGGEREVLTKAFRPFSCLTSCKKDVYTCCLLAACYAYLKEEELVHLAIEHAEAAQQEYHSWNGEEISAVKSPPDLLYLRLPIDISWFAITDIPAFFQLSKVPEVSLPNYKNNLLRILPELCNH